jgi:uncharacterized protein (TIGR02118 family)
VEALVYTPAEGVGDQPYAGDGPPPLLALQLDFEDIAALEAAIARGGHLQTLANAEPLRSLAGARVEHQAMLKRPFRARALERDGGAADTSVCTFLVAYPGSASDFPAWLAYYLEHHTAIMLKFPGLLGLDVYTRIDWCSSMPWARAQAMQRNKVVFNSVRALGEALASPVLRELREDVRRAPPVEGGSVHYPMKTQRVLPLGRE